MNQKGVTLLELLLALSLMTVIIVPVTGLVYYMLTTHQNVVNHNQLQHEARFIMEYMATKVREGARWDETSDRLVLDQEDGTLVTLLTYDGNRILFGEKGAYVASENVEHFHVKGVASPSQERLLQIYLELTHPETKHRYAISTQLLERRWQVEYSVPLEP